MLLAKLDADGNVEKFPYYNFDLELANELPNDVVRVNKTKKQPSFDWNKVAIFDTLVQEDGEWVVNYRVIDRFTNEEETLEFVKRELVDAKTRINNDFRTLTAALSSDYTELEQQSWPQQLAEAKQEGGDTPLLSAIAEARGISVSDLSAKIIEKNNAYNAAYGELLGTYSRKKQTLSEISIDDETTWNKLNELR